VRWLWIDAFVEFVSGQRASAVKNVTSAEEYMHDFVPGYPLLPPPLILEGMAQTAGILVGEARSFRENVILAKIRAAELKDYAVPGDQLRYDALLDSLDDRAGMTSGTIRKNGQTIGGAEMIFTLIPPEEAVQDAPAGNFVFTEAFMALLAGFRNRSAAGLSVPDGR
jgi:3-hydroxyacyl-[acyl-carrier-protein] dehydratase